MAAARPNPRPALGAQRVLQAVRARTVVTRKELHEESGVRETQLRRIITDLKFAKLLDETGPRIGTQRPIHLAGAAGNLIGVDVTLDRVTVAVARLDFERLDDPALATVQVTMDDPPATLNAIADLVVAQAGRCSIDVNTLVGVAIAMPGPMRRVDGVTGSPQLLRGWDGIQVGVEIETRLHNAGMGGVKVIVANDASLAALGTYTRGRMLNPTMCPDDLIYVRVETGVGAGIVMKGHLVTGADGFAGEIGHIRTEPDGEVCTRCGQRGCLESFASASAILERVRKRAREDKRPIPASLLDAVSARDPDALQSIELGGWHLGLVLGGIANLLNPSWIVLGGWVAETQWFHATARESLDRFGLRLAAQSVHVTTWQSMPAEIEPLRGLGERDPGLVFSPELLGALAFVIDELGDEYLFAAMEHQR